MKYPFVVFVKSDYLLTPLKSFVTKHDNQLRQYIIACVLSPLFDQALRTGDCTLHFKLMFGNYCDRTYQISVGINTKFNLNSIIYIYLMSRYKSRKTNWNIIICFSMQDVYFFLKSKGILHIIIDKKYIIQITRIQKHIK